MSVTVIDNPSANHPVFNPVEYEVTSDRNSTASFTATISDNGGFVKFSAGGMTLKVDDVVTCTGYSDNEVNTDVKVVSVVAGTSFTSNLVWDSFTSGASGTVTVNNRNLFVQVSVLESAVVKAVKDIKPLSGTFLVDIAKILQGLVTYDKVNTAGITLQSPATAGSAIVYTLTFQDIWTDIFGNSYSDTAVAVPTIGGDAIIGFNMALNGAQLFADYVCSVATPGEFLTVKKDPNNHVDEVCQLAFITEDATVKIKYTLRNYNGSTTGPITSAALTINNNRGIILIDGALFPVTAETMEIRVVEDSVDEFIMSETLTVSQRLKCLNGARVEWKNLLGGFDTYTFPEYENKQVNKVQSYQNTTWNTAQIKNTQTKKVIGEFSSPNRLDWLSELLTSREITIDGDNAIILNNNLITDSRNWKKPILTLRIDDKITN